MMDELLERRKRLPPYDPDRLGLNKPYVRIPPWMAEIGLGQAIKRVPAFSERYLFDPKTKAYINMPSRKKGKKSEKGEVYKLGN